LTDKRAKKERAYSYSTSLHTRFAPPANPIAINVEPKAAEVAATTLFEAEFRDY